MRLGIDMIEISRIRDCLKIPRFMQRVYSSEEIEELRKKNFAPQSAAAAFAAKEAFSKAIGTGVRGFSLNEVSLLHDDLGAPFLRLTGRAEEISAKLGYEYSVSVTHTQEYAATVVAAYKKHPEDID